MALMADQHGARTEMPTPLRLAEARRAGHVPRSGDLVCVAVLAAGVVTLAICGAELVDSLKEMTGQMLSQAGKDIAGQGAVGRLWPLIGPVAARALLLAGAIAVVAALANLVQFGWLATSEPIKPQMARLNPANGLRRVLSARSLVRGLLSVAKLGAVAAVLVAMLPEVGAGARSVATESLAAASSRLAGMAWRLSVRLTVVLALLSLVDLLYQRSQHRRDLRITRRQLLDDLRRMEGDPKQAGYRRAMAARLARTSRGQKADET
jgi:flagellar biosynthesis protein FlhB